MPCAIPPIKVNSAHPGWVKTDLGGSGASLDLSEGEDDCAIGVTR